MVGIFLPSTLALLNVSPVLIIGSSFCLPIYNHVSRATTAVAQAVGFPPSQLPHKNGSMTVLLDSPAPTSKKCRPRSLVAAPKTPCRLTAGRQWPSSRARRAAVEAMLWYRGAAVSLSPAQGRPSPLLRSPWQPQHLHPPPLGHFTKVK